MPAVFIDPIASSVILQFCVPKSRSSLSTSLSVWYEKVLVLVVLVPFDFQPLAEITLQWKASQS